MSEQTLVERANLLLGSEKINPKAKAFLLLKLCQAYTMLSSEKAELYWKQLQSMERHLGAEDKNLMAELRQMLEEEEDPTKGFAGEKIAEIKEKLAEPDLSEQALREFLEEKAEEVKKRFWPGGKQAVWEYLVQVWEEIDRNQALALTSKLSSSKRQLNVQKMNREKTLSPDEWEYFSRENSQNEAVRIIMAILDDPQPALNIPPAYIVPVVNGITKKMAGAGQLGQTLDQINKFLPLVAREELATQVCEALSSSVKTLSNSPALANQWPDKFNAALNLAIVGSKLGAVNNDTARDFADVLPKHMVDFGLSTCMALGAPSDNLIETLNSLKGSVSQKENAEAWFLVLTAQRGFGKQAYQLAKESPNRSSLVPRICRAWLSNYPEAAAQTIQPEDIQGDLVAQTLIKTDENQRVAFLRELTNEGTRPLPGSMWVEEAHLEEKKGFWGSMFSAGKSFEEIIQEYLKRNPLYVSYQRNTPISEQFKEFLRFNGYGEYNSKKLDPITLESLVLWGEGHPDEVKRELDLLWRSIEPDDNILKLDFLRNAIFERCTTVLAADPDKMNASYVAWLKRKLVDGSLVWQWGKTQYTVKYPPTAPSTMCLQGAIAVQSISTGRRDKLVEIALREHPSDDRLGELGAQLYNSGKTPLDIDLPWATKSKITEGWQMGIIKNAVPAIFQEIFQMGIKQN